MGFKTIINDLAKYLKGMILVNMLVLTLIIPVVFRIIGVETSMVALFTASGGFLLCVANLFFISGYFIRKTESTLTTSYASFEHDYFYDDLTKVYTRRAGLIRLDEEFCRARRSRSPLSVAMVDADHFKQINDTYGHLVGDEVLTHLASTLKAELRQCDVVIRYGGEEFLILLPDTDSIRAALSLERLRCRISERMFYHDGSEICLSISIGIATVSPIDDNPMNVIGRADSALYSAKKSGRNRVVCDYDYQIPAFNPALNNA